MAGRTIFELKPVFEAQAGKSGKFYFQTLSQKTCGSLVSHNAPETKQILKDI
jgi:hypothetical protein